MKTLIQLSIDSDLKRRLKDIKERTGVSIAKIINDLLAEKISDIEKKYEPLASPIFASSSSSSSNRKKAHKKEYREKHINE